MKHRYIWNLTFVAFLALTLVCLAGNTSEAQRSTGPEIKWETNEIPSAKGMKVHKLINARVDKRSFFDTSNKVLRKILSREKVRIKENDIGHALDFHAWVDRNDPSSLIMQDSKNGNLYFANRYNDFVSFTEVEDVPPPEDEAREIALLFLREMNFLPGDFTANAKLFHVGGMWGQDMKDGKTGAKIKLLTTLHFGRVLDGFSVQGPGSKIVMEIGRGGAVVSMNKKWNPIQGKNMTLNPNLRLPGTIKLNPNLKIREQSEMSPMQSILEPDFKQFTFAKPAEFYSGDELKLIFARELRNEWTSAESILIRKVELCYFDRSGNFIQPAYAVEAVINTSEGSFNYLHHVAALREAPEPIYLAVKAEMPRFKDDRAPTETSQEVMD